MKKFILFLSCSLAAVNAAQALSASEQMNAMRDIFAREFQKMDANNDGVLNMEEFLKHQFMEFRNTVSQSDGFELPATPTTSSQQDVKAPVLEEKQAKDQVKAKGLDALSEVSQTLQAMADYDMDLDDGYDYDALFANDNTDTTLLEETEAEPENEEAVNTVEETVPELDFSLSEEESLQNMMAKDDKAAASQKAEKESQTRQLKFMLETIKKTLPKKVDEITTWTDIEYQDNAIAYIYKADVDTSKFSSAEKEALKNSVETIACVQAYTEMCPKVKTMFIKDGINMKIRYLDKLENEISSCEFNEKTCQ